MNGTVRVWDLAGQSQPSKTLDHDSPLFVVRFSPDDRLLATGCEDGSARVWNVASGQPVGSKMQHEQPVVSFSWDRHGKQLATINGRTSSHLRGNAVQLWNPSTGLPSTPQFGREIGSGFGMGRVQFSPTANQLVIQYADDANVFD